MARTSIYLNFNRTTEAAFTFYKSVFKTDFVTEIARMGEAPANPAHPLPESDKNLVLHVELPVTGGLILMGTDATESMGIKLHQGNTVHINLEPDTRDEATRLFIALSGGGRVTTPLQDMFWGAYFGSCTDKFGTSWMVNVQN